MKAKRVSEQCVKCNKRILGKIQWYNYVPYHIRCFRNKKQSAFERSVDEFF